MTGEGAKLQHAENLRTVYRELCTSYRAIDDFREKLLGFLPLATGTGIFLFIDKGKPDAFPAPYLSAIGAFGFAITLALFFYELYGIKKCTYLIMAEKKLEKELKINNGQFTTRPHGVAGFIDEPFAAGVIYPAVMAAWTYLLVLAIPHPHHDAPWWALRVFIVNFAVSFLYNLKLIVGEEINKVIVYLKTHLRV